MNLNAQQKRALDNARMALSADPNDVTGPLAASWHSAIRLALRDVLAAFEEDGEDDGEEPVPPPVPLVTRCPICLGLVRTADGVHISLSSGAHIQPDPEQVTA